MTTLICNGRLLDGSSLVTQDLWIKGDKIIDPKDVDYMPDRVIDVKGKIITPGFVDIKVNGSFNVDFASDVTVEDVVNVCRNLPPLGVTSFCPSIQATTRSRYDRLFEIFTTAKKRCRDAEEPHADMLGFFLDGPFHNSKKSDENTMAPTSISPKALQELYGDALNFASIVSLAPELQGSIETIEYLTSQGIKVSLSHTQCSIEQAEDAVNAGATVIGHLFNGMPNFHHRDPSLVGILASSKIKPCKQIHFGLIADTIHTHPASLVMAYKVGRKDGLMLVSDSCAPTGTKQLTVLDATCATSRIGEQKVELKRGSSDEWAVYKTGTNELIGSCTHLTECLKNMLCNTDCTLIEGLKACSKRPANAVGEALIGTLSIGLDADVIILDEELDIKGAFVKGRYLNNVAPTTSRQKLSKSRSIREKTDLQDMIMC